MRNKKIGVYQIRNKLNGKIYVGSTGNTFYEREYKHWNGLKNQNFNHPHLQNAYNKYGKEKFIFEVIEEVEWCEDQEELKEKLLAREQYWIDKTKCYDGRYGYNTCIVANSRLGVKTSEETKRKMSEAQRGELTPNAKLNWKIVKEIRKKYATGDYTRDDFAKKYNVSCTCIQRLLENFSWYDENYIPKFPIEKLRKNAYNKMVETTRNNSSLEWKDVNKIRKLSKEGKLSWNQIAKKYNMSAGATQAIIENKSWHDENYKPVKIDILERNKRIGIANSGENCGTSVLTWEKVREIRKKYKPYKYLQKDLAEEYGVAESTIQSIINETSWKE